MGCRTAARRRWHLGGQRGTVGLLFSLQPFRYSGVPGAGRCRLRLRAGFGHTGSAFGPICCGRAHDPLENLSLTPAGVWHFYDGRAGMERRIREIREDFALPKIPTRAFAANAPYLEDIQLAYNLVTAFQRTCLPQEAQTLTLRNLPHRLFDL